MSFVICCVLACATILATFMLQLADDSPDSSASILGVVTFVAILTALYFVDYRKKFALSKRACNFLLILAVAFQIGALTHSRHEILAFAIANILASLQAILFFQSKTLRKCYQILFISFVEVAVGCVFQRSSFFVISLPIYAILSFLCFSLLFLWGERKYYLERVELKRRFTGNKNLPLISAEEPIRQTESKAADSFGCATAAAYGKSSNLADPPRFFRRQSIPTPRYSLCYFYRFVSGALVAFVFAACFFCVFPRMEEFGFGALTFDNISWGSPGGARGAKTGFSPKIELGDLGPSLDSHETVMTVRFVDCLDKKKPFPLDPLAPIYLRGMPLANYSDRSWLELISANPARNLTDLRYKISDVAVADPDFVLSYLIKIQEERGAANVSLDSDDELASDFDAPVLAQKEPRVLYQFLPQGMRGSSQWNGGFNPFLSVPGMTTEPPRPDPVAQEMFRSSRSGNLVRAIPERRQLSNFRDFSKIDDLVDLISKKLIDVENLGYDVRNGIVGYDIELKPLDTNVVFAPSASYVAKSFPDLYETSSCSLQLYDSRNHSSSGGNFWFLSTSVRNRRQTSLVPNQEVVWPYLAQYLAIDKNKFPKLIALAQGWDDKSGLPKENFVARARYIESSLRDTGAYKYNRSGVVRNPSIDPLEDFISEHKEGHCEYFSGGLALLLRAIGVPARVVVGYATYPDSDGKPTIIRQSDAHSWVEAYIPPDKLPKVGDVDADLFPASALDETGKSCLPPDNDKWIDDGMWLRLDATPASDRDSDRPDALTIGIYTWSNLFKSLGRDFVLNFDAGRQMRNVYAPLVLFWRSAVDSLRSFQGVVDAFNAIFGQIADTLKKMLLGRWTPSVVLRFSVLAAFVLAFVAIGKKLCDHVKRRFRELKDAANKKSDKSRRDNPVAVLYFRLEKGMEVKLDLKRQNGETSREFIERCFAEEDARALSAAATRASTVSSGKKLGSDEEDGKAFAPTSAPMRSLLLELVELYYAVQFGSRRPSPQETDRWTVVLRDANIA